MESGASHYCCFANLGGEFGSLRINQHHHNLRLCASCRYNTVRGGAIRVRGVVVVGVARAVHIPRVIRVAAIG